ncbi:MAG: carotenoid oxygenase family protein, partial [Verrucomicrobiota bacterium]
MKLHSVHTQMEKIYFRRMHASAVDPYNAVMLAWPGELDQTWDDIVEGELPAELIGGTFWSNGPGRLLHGGRLIHPFDGNGYLRAIRFLPGKKVRLQARMVQTQTFRDEEKAGKVVWAGLGTLPSDSWWSNLWAPLNRNVANTCVLPWAGKILALWEGGWPHAVNPETLETLGPESFDGALPKGGAFLAHTRWDARQNRLLGLSPRILGPKTEFTGRELDASGRQISAHT